MIHTASVPQVDYRVRRRVVDGRPYLIRHNDWFALDAQVDRVWRACASGSSVREIAASLAKHEGLPPADALAGACIAVDRLRSAGLIALPDDGVDLSSPMRSE